MITNENAPKAGRPEANFETTFSQNNNQDQADSQADSIPVDTGSKLTTCAG
ncbi:hypothetical protein [Nitrosomonas ureae]|uniref:Uncharacterized protein n=1 Tax=Nitrosomonas ureae TaxID=44577 RepID=A0A286A3R9_9PROT|nr:hypothetical protein [Nitrosomonas ureae]SOD16555.1 hypothetical protein SAMN06297164_0630 [Nitrosomonas ureae]